MTIRPATEADIPAIVELLKLSLGESLMPKSEAFWRWKHVDNPFGRSPVLLAWDGEKLIGVRAFMRWEWRQRDKIFKSVRAVDTATHPGYQGNGIFKKLTLALVEQCRGEGVNFIFNTPNKISMPGYLKMGWQKNGRMKISIWPVFLSNRKEKYQHDLNKSELPIPNIQTGENMFTNASPDFLKWRYTENPNIEYFQFQSKYGNGLFRIKKGRYFSEMRITEFFWNGDNKSEVREMIQNTARGLGVRIITWSGFKLPMPSLAIPLGPIITVLPLNGDNSLSFGRWNPTLGDMEVF